MKKDYLLEFVRHHCHEEIVQSEIRERFCEANVFQEIERDIGNHINKKYLVVNERDLKDSQNGTERATVACASGAVEMAIVFEKNEFARKLIEAGMEVRLDAGINLLLCDRDGTKILKFTLLEVMLVYGDAIPNDFRAFLWKKIEESGKLGLNRFFDLSYKYDNEVEKKLMQSAKYVQEHCAEAADMVLRAVVRNYINAYGLDEIPIWEELFGLFAGAAGKNRVILEEMVFGKAAAELNPIIWELYQRTATEEEIKETIVLIIYQALKKNTWGIRNGAEEVIRFFEEIMSEKGYFGELYTEQRDECVRILLDWNGPSLELLRILLKTDFVPTACMDFYIEILQNTNIGLTLSLFIAEKMRRG